MTDSFANTGFLAANLSYSAVIALQEGAYRVSPYASPSSFSWAARGALLALPFEAVDIAVAAKSGSGAQVAVEVAGAFGSWELR